MTSKFREAMPLLVVSIFLIAPYLAFLLFFPYKVSGGDESYQIQAAIKMVAGEGYVSSLYTLPKDLAVGAYSYLYSWPIGYSAIIAIFLKLGVSAAHAAALWQAITVVFGFFVWAICAQRFLKEKWAQFSFLGILGMHFFSWGNYNTAAFSWGLTGCITYLLLNWRESGKDSSAITFALCSFITVILVFLRFQNVTFIPALFLFYFFSDERDRWKITFGKIKDLFLLCAPPAFTFIGIIYTNGLWGAGSSPTSTRKAGIYLDLFSWMFPKWVSGLFWGGGFRFEDAMPAIATRLNWNLTWFERIVDTVSIFMMLGVLYLAFRNRKKIRIKNSFEWFFISYLSLMAMLVYVALRYHLNYTYGHTRYFHYLIPALLLPILICVESSMRKFGNLLASILVILGFATCLAFVVHRNSMHQIIERKAQAVMPVVEKIFQENPESASFIAADSVFPALVMKGYPNLHLETKPMLQAENYFSKSTIVMVIHDKKPVKEMYADLQNLDQVIKRFNLKLELDAEEVSIYWAKLPAGPAPAL